MNIKRYYAVVGIIALVGEIVFDSIVFRMVISFCFGIIIGASDNG